jgi:hypothetical protein
MCSVYNYEAYISYEFQECKTGLNIINKTGEFIIHDVVIYFNLCYIRMALTLNDDTELNSELHKFSSDKIILSDRYYVYNPRTIKKFNLEVNAKFISGCCEYGDVKFLEWWLKSNLPLEYDETALTCASRKGHVNVLEWWLKSGLELKYDTWNIMNNASRRGHIHVLEWWLKSGLPLKYDEDALTYASYDGNVNVLDWWLKSNLPLKYDEWGLNFASEKGHINVLEWWLKSGLELKYDEYALKFASNNGHIQVLEWWKNSGLLKNR